MNEATEYLRRQPPSLAHPVQAAHQTPRLSQPSSRRPVNSLPAPAPPEPDLGRPLRLSSVESASSLPSLAGQGLLSELQAPGRRRLPDAQANRTARRDARTRAGLARDLGRAGPGLEEAPLPGSPGRPVTPPAPHTSAPPARRAPG